MAEIIDLNNEQWLIQHEYIVYNKGNFEKYHVANAMTTFSNIYNEKRQSMMSDAQDSQLKAFQKQSKTNMKLGKDSLNLLIELDENGNSVLQMIFEEIATRLNNDISKESQSLSGDFVTVLSKLQSSNANSLLSKGKAEKQDVVDFFNYLFEALNLVTKIPTDTLNVFTDIANQLSLEEIKSSDFNTVLVGTLTKEQEKMINSILNSLQKATNKLNENGIVGARSFSSTIANIFSTQIGEYIAKKILQSSVQEALTVTDNILKNDKLKDVTISFNSNTKFTQAGTRTTVSNTTSKSDVLNSKGVIVNVRQNNQDFDIEMFLNTSVKWYQGLVSGGTQQIHIVNSTPVSKYLLTDTQKFYGFNLIAQYSKTGNLHEAFRTLRAALSASFFNDWLTGTGQSIKRSSSYIDRSQFISVNGEVYSMLRIIRNICEEYAQKNASDKLSNFSTGLSFDAGSVGTYVQAGKNKSNYVAAKERSDLAREALNKIKISASFNSNVLSKYAY